MISTENGISSVSATIQIWTSTGGVAGVGSWLGGAPRAGGDELTDESGWLNTPEEAPENTPAVSPPNHAMSSGARIAEINTVARAPGVVRAHRVCLR